MPMILHNWDSFLYQFIAGGIFFSIGIILPIISGDAKWSRQDDRITIVAIIVSAILFFSFYISWQIYAIHGG